MITKQQTAEPAAALYLNLSCLDEANIVIGSSQVVPRLVQLLYTNSSTQCKHDSLYALYNVSTHQSNIPCLLSSGILDGLYSILMAPPSPEGDLYWSEKALAVLINLASTPVGRKEILSCPGLITYLATLLDTGESTEQEQTVACLLVMCNGDEQCIPVILQEGIIPSLVSISVNGTARGQEKANKLLKLFREQRQREPLFSLSPEGQEEQYLEQLPRKMQQMVVKKSMCKSKSKKFGRTLSAFLKYRSCSVYQC
jgi:hypothetical protein